MSLTHLTELCRNVMQAGVVVLLQSSFVLLLGLGMGAALRRRGPLAQSIVYRATLLAVMVTAACSVTVGGVSRGVWRVSLPSAPVRTIALEAQTAPPVIGNEPPPRSVSRPPASDTNSATAPDRGPRAPAAQRGVSPWDALYIAGAGLWGAGSLALLLWLGLGQCYLAHLRQRSAIVTSGDAAEVLHSLCVGRRVPALRVSPAVRSPFLAGLWRPEIFLPASYATDFDAHALRAILAHELAHEERRDTFWALLARLSCVILWPQPLLWLLCRRMEHASEEACDARALAQDCPPLAYADCLLSLAERLTPSPMERAVGLGVLPFRSQVGRRISAILECHPMSVVTRRLLIAVSVGALSAVALGLSLVCAGGAPPGGLSGASAAQTDQEARCLSNVRAITRALLQYASEHGQRLPQALHWMDDVQPYIKDSSIFHDPGARPSQRWSYAFNASLSGVRLDRIEAPAQVVAVFESETDAVMEPPEGVKNGRSHGETVPRISRHHGRATFGFADGHTALFPNAQKPNFRAGVPIQGAPVPPSRRDAPLSVDTRRQAWADETAASLKPQIEKARQDLADFKRAHPDVPSPVQAAQIKRLIDLRLERNDRDAGIRFAAVVRAKHVARLRELGPSQSAERLKWEAEIRRIDAQARQWHSELPALQRQVSDQEKRVQPFAADYLEMSRRSGEYRRLLTEYQALQQIDRTLPPHQQYRMLLRNEIKSMTRQDKPRRIQPNTWPSELKR